MKTRPMTAEDVPAIEDLISASNLPYPSLSSPLIETVQVVENDNQEIIAAFIAERMIEGHVVLRPMLPHAKLHALRLLHESTPEVLREKGYSWINCFLPSPFALSFGRRLERSFGWIKDSQSWRRKF